MKACDNGFQCNFGIAANPINEAKSTQSVSCRAQIKTNPVKTNPVVLLQRDNHLEDSKSNEAMYYKSEELLVSLCQRSWILKKNMQRIFLEI